MAKPWAEGSGLVSALACGWKRRRLCRNATPLADVAPQSKEPRLDVAPVVLTHPGIGDGVEQLIKPLFERRAPLGRVEIVARAFALPQNIDERPRLSETACESAGALIAHEVVGIRALRQESEAEGMALAQNRQHAVDGARCGSLAGPVAVEADDRLGREQPKLIHLAFGEGGAERRHGLMEACLMQRNHVHVAFDHDELALVEGRPPRPGEVEHGEALVEQLGLRRVQIFRLGCRMSARAPKAMMRPRALTIGMVSRWRKRS